MQIIEKGSLTFQSKREQTAGRLKDCSDSISSWQKAAQGGWDAFSAVGTFHTFLILCKPASTTSQMSPVGPVWSL